MPISAHGERLDRALGGIVPEFSRTYLQQLIESGAVRLNGQLSSRASAKVKAGDRVQIELKPTPQSQAFKPEVMTLDVVFEDAHLLVINKPAGLVVHPAPGNWSGTLLNGLLARDEATRFLPRAGIVHRLDKDTSGLMVVARTLTAMTALARAIAAREVGREYLALVHGVPRQAAWSVESPIGRDPVSRVKMAVLPGGRSARTDVRTLGAAEAVAAVHCRLHTGRTHQIRVHLASQGHPLVGDQLYGGRPALGLSRQALHAARLAFAHPVSGERLSFEAPLPDDLGLAWEQVLPGGLLGLVS